MFNRNIIFHKRTEEFTGLPVFISSGVAIIQNKTIIIKHKYLPKVT